MNFTRGLMAALVFATGATAFADSGERDYQRMLEKLSKANGQILGDSLMDNEAVRAAVNTYMGNLMRRGHVKALDLARKKLAAADEKRLLELIQGIWPLLMEAEQYRVKAVSARQAAIAKARRQALQQRQKYARHVAREQAKYWQRVQKNRARWWQNYYRQLGYCR